MHLDKCNRILTELSTIDVEIEEEDKVSPIGVIACIT